MGHGKWGAPAVHANPMPLDMPPFMPVKPAIATARYSVRAILHGPSVQIAVMGEAESGNLQE